jgi:hypothetical protein
MPKVSRDTDRFSAWIDSMLYKGLGGDRIYEAIKEQAGEIETRTGKEQEYLSRQRIRDYVRPLRQDIRKSVYELPTREEETLSAFSAAKLNFNSPVGNRFLLTFQFSALSNDTGELIKMEKTLGFKKEITWGDAQDRIHQIIEAVLRNPRDYKMDGILSLANKPIKIISFVRNS